MSATSRTGDRWIIAGGGAVTPLGTNLAQTAASIIAKLRRFRRVSLPDISVKPFTISEVRGVTTDLTGLARLQVMLESALVETIASLPAPGYIEGHALLVLALPDELNAQAVKTMLDFADAIVRAHPTWTALKPRAVAVQKGAAGGFAALDLAYRELSKDDALSLAIVAGVDSRVEPTLLKRAAEANLILQRGNQEGYVAAEAAAAVLLYRRADIPAKRYALMPPALAEGETLWPRERDHDGDVLQPVLEAALGNAQLQTEHISHWLCDSDGSVWRSREEQNALSRIAVSTQSSIDGEVPELAIRMGQVGAAWGPLMWGLTHTFAYYEAVITNAGLCWAVDPSGRVGAAAIVRSAQSPGPLSGAVSRGERANTAERVAANTTNTM
jgi:hypothetical protein